MFLTHLTRPSAQYTLMIPKHFPNQEVFFALPSLCYLKDLYLLPEINDDCTEHVKTNPENVINTNAYIDTYI